MRQHQTTDDITHGVDVGQVGAVVLVHLHEALVVEGEAGILGEQVIGIRTAPDGHDQPVEGFAVLVVTRLILDFHPRLLRLGTQHAGTETDIQTLFLEVASGFFGNLLIGHRNELVHCLQQHNLGTQT